MRLAIAITALALTGLNASALAAPPDHANPPGQANRPEHAADPSPNAPTAPSNTQGSSAGGGPGDNNAAAGTARGGENGTQHVPLGQTETSKLAKDDAQNSAAPKGEPRKRNPSGAAPPPDQTQALEAVATGQALPLARIVGIAETRGEGRVINAKLLRVQNVLLYQLTMLDEAGRSRRTYYFARTGKPVRIN